MKFSEMTSYRDLIQKATKVEVNQYGKKVYYIQAGNKLKTVKSIIFKDLQETTPRECQAIFCVEFCTNTNQAGKDLKNFFLKKK